MRCHCVRNVGAISQTIFRTAAAILRKWAGYETIGSCAVKTIHHRDRVVTSTYCKVQNVTNHSASGEPVMFVNKNCGGPITLKSHSTVAGLELQN